MDRYQLLCCHVFVTYFTKYYSLNREYPCFVLLSENTCSVTQRTKLVILFSQEISEKCDWQFYLVRCPFHLFLLLY